MNKGFDLRGRRVLLTGAAGGIGMATARVFATLGAELILADLIPMDSLKDELKELGSQVTTFQCDVSSRSENTQLALLAGPVDCAISCAGICPQDVDLFDSGAEWDEIFHKVMDVNVLGSIHLAREMIPRMYERGEGRIVLIGSIGGRMGGISPIVQPHYVASKGGIHAVVWWLAKRAASYGVLVNGIAPGPIETPMTETTPYSKDVYPLGRIGRPEEIAWPAAFLCSPGASYLSGVILDVNGGLYTG